MIPLWMFPVATAAGNCMVLKPSERDPGAAMMLAELALEAGGCCCGPGWYPEAERPVALPAPTGGNPRCVACFGRLLGFLAVRLLASLAAFLTPPTHPLPFWFCQACRAAC